mmetsp:Transcript_22298/g.72323  ORF Transcript_22298/g.72323 Transcript_22298/m.72323 type:complete len:274 (+) Transcript_22298:3158-3979(+)
MTSAAHSLAAGSASFTIATSTVSWWSSIFLMGVEYPLQCDAKSDSACASLGTPAHFRRSASAISTAMAGDCARERSSSTGLSTMAKPWSTSSSAERASSKRASAVEAPRGATAGKVPVKRVARLTTTPSPSSMRASTSPASTGAPAVLARSVTLPGPFCARSGMIIFITSTSAYGWPGCTTSPSSTKYETSFPALGAWSAVGSASSGKKARHPLICTLSPVGVRSLEVTKLCSPMSTLSPPSNICTTCVLSSTPFKLTQYTVSETTITVTGYL